MTSGTSWETVTAGTATQNLLSGPRNRVAATVAPLDSVDGLAVDAAGNVVISDALDYLVWVVAARAGRFYGQAMKAGHLYSIAGTGNFGYSGDGGPATSAKLGRPTGLAFDPSGNLLIADSLDSVVLPGYVGLAAVPRRRGGRPGRRRADRRLGQQSDP